ncbi:hypothetical protein J6590_023031 [Homalodisca vitripennis]|nr:hypothetical protein J6590_023031 [Homalodisca vitripennis]
MPRFSLSIFDDTVKSATDQKPERKQALWVRWVADARTGARTLTPLAALPPDKLQSVASRGRGDRVCSSLLCRCATDATPVMLSIVAARVFV